VWYRDTTYGNINSAGATTTALPSTGSKGGLLIVDSHFDPFRRTGVAAAKDPSTLNNLPSRPQSSNTAFGLVPTKPFTECFELLPTEPFSEYCTDIAAQAPVSTFTDTKTWYPGIEIRNNGALRPDWYGADLGANIVLGTGSPADDGVSFNTWFQVLEVKTGNTAAKIHIVPPTP
jgi:immune inhibitor A